MELPEKDDPGCPYCARRGCVMNSHCRGCVIRWLSRQPQPRRSACYELYRAKLSKDEMWALVERVRAEYALDKDEAVERRAMKEAERQRLLAKAREALG